MRYAESPGVSLEAPPPDQVRVVFVGRGYTTVWDPTALLFEDQEIIGALMMEDALVHTTRPGKHRFMVMSEAADFLEAELGGGRVYVIQVTDRMGMWRTRQSLRPVQPSTHEWAELVEGLPTAFAAAPSTRLEEWYAKNASSVKSRRKAYLTKWLAKSERPQLDLEDGVTLWTQPTPAVGGGPR